MEKQQQSYHFKGNTEDTINSILSLLFGKEYYQEISYYSNFINDSQPLRYRKKIEAILDLMQKESLILIRENTSPGGWIFPLSDSSRDISPPSQSSRVYLRQYGKDVLSKGGYKKKELEEKQTKFYPEFINTYSSELAISVILFIVIWFII